MFLILIAAVLGLLGLALLLLDVSRRSKAASQLEEAPLLSEDHDETPSVGTSEAPHADPQPTVDEDPLEVGEDGLDDSDEDAAEVAEEEVQAEPAALEEDDLESGAVDPKAEEEQNPAMIAEDLELEDLPETTVADQVIETNLTSNAPAEEDEYFEGETIELPREEPAVGVFSEQDPYKSGFRVIPVSMRRERKTWAAHHGFEYSKVDNFLNDEWARGAASAGAPAKDVVSGTAAGHEMYFVDLAGVPVMAMRRPGSSDVVVDMRRGELDNAQNSDDLIHVCHMEGFTILSNDQGATERMLDVRARRALAAMPQAVTAVWIESDWVLAQTTKNADHTEWDALFKPLAQMSDAARVLPPRTGASQPIDLSEMDPSRPLPNAPVSFTDDEEDPTPVIPKIEREEERAPLPTRARGESHGVVEPREVGGDEVEAIAQNLDESPQNYQGTRIVRDNTHKPTIFGD